jgi:hypothetical protein
MGVMLSVSDDGVGLVLLIEKRKMTFVGRFPGFFLGRQ